MEVVEKRRKMKPAATEPSAASRRSRRIKFSSDPTPLQSTQEGNEVATMNINPELADAKKGEAQVYAKKVQDAENMLKEEAYRKREEAAHRQRVEKARRVLESRHKKVLTIDPQLAAAYKEISWHSGYAAAAALLPPLLDVVTVTGVQLKMLSDRKDFRRSYFRAEG
jgi:hypothetical protein